MSFPKIAVFLLPVVLLGAGCVPGTTTQVIPPPQPPTDEAPIWLAWSERATLRVQETAQYKNLYVTLKSIEDSRCPVDVTCVWAGELAAVLEVQAGDLQQQEVRLGQTTSPTVTVGSYVFTLYEVTTAEATISVALVNN